MSEYISCCLSSGHCCDIELVKCKTSVHKFPFIRDHWQKIKQTNNKQIDRKQKETEI